MSPMEISVGSIVALIALNPANVAIYIPLLGVALIGFLYIEK